MKYLALLAISLTLIACSATPSVTPIHESNAATRVAIHSFKEENKKTVESVQAGNVILEELIPSLTPQQQQKATLAKEQFEQAIEHAKVSDQKAQEAEDHAKETDLRADELQAKVGRYKDFWDRGHTILGALAIFLTVLFKHLMIFLAILAIGGILLAVFAPGAIGVIRSSTGVFTSWVKSTLDRFKKK